MSTIKQAQRGHAAIHRCIVPFRPPDGAIRVACGHWTAVGSVAIRHKFPFVYWITATDANALCAEMKPVHPFPIVYYTMKIVPVRHVIRAMSFPTEPVLLIR